MKTYVTKLIIILSLLFFVSLAFGQGDEATKGGSTLSSITIPVLIAALGYVCNRVMRFLSTAKKKT